MGSIPFWDQFHTYHLSPIFKVFNCLFCLGQLEPVPSYKTGWRNWQGCSIITKNFMFKSNFNIFLFLATDSYYHVNIRFLVINQNEPTINFRFQKFSINFLTVFYLNWINDYIKLFSNGWFSRGCWIKVSHFL